MVREWLVVLMSPSPERRFTVYETHIIMLFDSLWDIFSICKVSLCFSHTTARLSTFSLSMGCGIDLWLKGDVYWNISALWLELSTSSADLTAFFKLTSTALYRTNESSISDHWKASPDSNLQWYLSVPSRYSRNHSHTIEQRTSEPSSVVYLLTFRHYLEESLLAYL